MGAHSAAAAAELNAIRTVISTRTRSNWVMFILLLSRWDLAAIAYSTQWSCCRLLAPLPVLGRSFEPKD